MIIFKFLAFYILNSPVIVIKGTIMAIFPFSGRATATLVFLEKVKDNFVSDSSSELNVVAGDGSENSAFCGNA
ncbi:hypothetical protein DICPUDRAFT_156628, partial [Dictyostelium purpureum]